MVPFSYHSVIKRRNIFTLPKPHIFNRSRHVLRLPQIPSASPACPWMQRWTNQPSFS